MKLIDHMERESFDVNDALGIDRHAAQPARLKAIAALRASNAALERRVGDLELMLRGLMGNRNMVCAEMDTNGVGWFWRAHHAESWRALPIDGTGLPVLTDAARAALQGGSQDEV